MNPAALAETHPNCRTNAAGEPLLPNGTPWRQQLLMLGLSSKLLVDAEKALDIRKVSQAGGGARDLPCDLYRYVVGSSSEAEYRVKSCWRTPEKVKSRSSTLLAMPPGKRLGA